MSITLFSWQTKVSQSWRGLVEARNKSHTCTRTWQKWWTDLGMSSILKNHRMLCRFSLPNTVITQISLLNSLATVFCTKCTPHNRFLESHLQTSPIRSQTKSYGTLGELLKIKNFVLHYKSHCLRSLYAVKRNLWEQKKTHWQGLLRKVLIHNYLSYSKNLDQTLRSRFSIGWGAGVGAIPQPPPYSGAVYSSPWMFLYKFFDSWFRFLPTTIICDCNKFRTELPLF